MPYKHIFFDLDHTLWDADKNVRESLSELLIKHQIGNADVEFNEAFINYFLHVNEQLWEQYRKDEIEKDFLRIERFEKTLKKFDVYNKVVAQNIADDFIALTPLKKNLIPDCEEILNYLKDKYRLHILTNGFTETQQKKLQNTGINHFFDEVITPDSSGFKKPDSRIFHYALKKAGASPQNSVMVGDTFEVDVIGALNVGIKPVFFNPFNISHNQSDIHDIKRLKELLQIL